MYSSLVRPTSLNVCYATRDVAHDERNPAVWDAALGGGHKARVCWQIDSRRWTEALYRALRYAHPFT